MTRKDGMTPEERFQKIENALNTLSEHLAHFEAENAEYRKQQAEKSASTDAQIKELREMHSKLGLAVLATNQQVGEVAGKVGELAGKVGDMAKKVDTLTGKIDSLTDAILKGMRPNGGTR